MNPPPGTIERHSVFHSYYPLPAFSNQQRVSAGSQTRDHFYCHLKTLVLLKTQTTCGDLPTKALPGGLVCSKISTSNPAYPAQEKAERVVTYLLVSSLE